MPTDGGEDSSKEAVSGDAGTLVPIVGSVYPSYIELFKREVSEDGQFVALRENLYHGEPSSRYTSVNENPRRYLIVKRVDDDAEVFRLLLNVPGDKCGHPHAVSVCEERQARADAFLSRHKWVKFPEFMMDPASRAACSQKPQRQRLAFRNLEITSGALRVIATRPSGDILVDRKLKGWRVFQDEPIPPNDLFYVDSIGLSIEKRVLLVGVRPCGGYANSDTDPRFHAIRLPPID